MNDYILIEYSNSVDFGDIIYHNGFENRVWLKADVSKPEYELLEEGIEDGEGEFHPTFQKWAKRYSIVFHAQEFLTDALTLMTLHDQVYVTLKNGENSQVLDIEVDPKWDADIECWAEVTATFTTDYIIRKKCDENIDADCLALAPIVGADDTYDAGDSGAGEARWNNPVGNDGDTSFFYTSLSGCEEYANLLGIPMAADDPIGFYTSTNGAWVLHELEIGQVGTAAIGDPPMLIKVEDNKYNRVAYLCSVTDQTGGVARLTALSVELDTQFFSIWADTGGGFVEIDAALATKFDNGYDVTVGAGVGIEFRIVMYNHSCDYGEDAISNVVIQTIT